MGYINDGIGSGVAFSKLQHIVTTNDCSYDTITKNRKLQFSKADFFATIRCNCIVATKLADQSASVKTKTNRQTVSISLRHCHRHVPNYFNVYGDSHCGHNHMNT